jgi:hypothetical protein
MDMQRLRHPTASIWKVPGLLAFLSLLALAILCGLIWRWEVDYHGWEGLIWISYFHWAVPLAFGLFLIWANLFVRLPWHRRLGLNSVAFVYGCLLYYFLVNALVYRFMTGPSAMFMHMSMPAWRHYLWGYALLILVPFLPLGTYLIMKLFGKHVPWGVVVAALVCMVLSGPLAKTLLDLVAHRGGSDDIHWIKSGFLIPIWVFANGLLIVGHVMRERRA